MAALLDFFPDYRESNPFQEMLYAGLADVGLVARPSGDIHRYLAVGSGTLHLHWTAPILHPARGPYEAYHLTETFLTEVRQFRARGGRLVWTIHNVLPHDARYPIQEMLLARGLVAEADLIHVLAPGTDQAVSDYYGLDQARTVLIEHSSYLGVYPDTLSRQEARWRLGLAQDALAVASVGGIRSYKGLDRLIDVVAGLHDRNEDVRLLLAGRLGTYPGSDAFARRVATEPWIVAGLEHVPDEDLQVWMRAADIAVLPYRTVLNSGAFMLAQTFGLPTVAPRTGALLEFADRAHVRLFEPSDAASLQACVAELLAASVEDAEPLRQSALRLASERPPAAMAARFAETVASVVAR